MLNVFLIPNLYLLNIVILLYLLSSTFGSSFTSFICVFSIILPSCIFIILVAYSSICSILCVTKTTNLFWATLFNISITSFADSVSKFPVGSSATMIGVSFTIALAIATLCFCPPDNFDTFVFLNFVNPTWSIISNIFPSHLFRPPYVCQNEPEHKPRTNVANICLHIPIISNKYSFVNNFGSYFSRGGENQLNNYFKHCDFQGWITVFLFVTQTSHISFSYAP